MSKLSRAIAGGVGAGLQQYGRTLGALYEQQAKEKRIDERLAIEDARDERLLSMKEEEHALRKKSAERQAELDTMELEHRKMTKTFANPDANVDTQLKAISDYWKDGKNYINSPGKIGDYPDETGKLPFMVVDVSMNVTEKATGEIKPDPLTGGAMQKQSEFGPKILRTEQDWINWKAQVSNSPAYAARALSKATSQDAIDSELALKEALSKTPEGRAALASIKVKTGLAEAQTGLAEAKTKEIEKGVKGKPKSKMKNLDGSESTLTTPEMNQRKDDAARWGKKIRGITAQEVRYIEQGTQKWPKLIPAFAQEIVNSGSDPKEMQQAHTEIMDKFQVSLGTAKELLRGYMEGIDSTEPSWVDKLLRAFVGKDPETGAPVEEEPDVGGVGGFTGSELED